MKLIIDIPEDTYRATCTESMLPLDVKNVVNAIRNGIPYEEQPQGEWVNMNFDFAKYYYKCSICGREINTHGNPLSDYPFCHCGASMRGKGGDNNGANNT